jgi:hypothetical protein
MIFALLSEESQEPGNTLFIIQCVLVSRQLINNATKTIVFEFPRSNTIFYNINLFVFPAVQHSTLAVSLQ